jgi:DNA polymerase III delta subunit
MSKTIQFLHGENIVKSRQVLTEKIENFREKGIEVEILSGSQLTLEQARSALGSNSLFGKDKVVVIENLYSSPQSMRREKLINYLKREKFANELILWERKDIKRKFPSSFSVEVFRLSSAIFKFLESLKPDNTQASLRLLAEAKSRESEEMIFYLLVRQIRLLIQAKDLGEKGLAELQSWQKTRFLSQAKHFSLKQLTLIHQKLLEMDYKQKTSGTPFSLASELDLLVASL